MGGMMADIIRTYTPKPIEKFVRADPKHAMLDLLSAANDGEIAVDPNDHGYGTLILAEWLVRLRMLKALPYRDGTTERTYLITSKGTYFLDLYLNGKANNDAAAILEISRFNKKFPEFVLPEGWHEPALCVGVD